MLGLVDHALILVARNGDEGVVGPLSRQGDDDEVAEPLEHVLDETPRVVP